MDLALMVMLTAINMFLVFALLVSCFYNLFAKRKNWWMTGMLILSIVMVDMLEDQQLDRAQRDLIYDDYYDSLRQQRLEDDYYESLRKQQLQDEYYEELRREALYNDFNEEQDGELISKGNPQTKKLTVSSVIDGDTLILSNGETVRLIGINAPEAGRSCSAEATSKLKDLVQGKEIFLESDIETQDQYGRSLKYVFVGGSKGKYKLVNYELIRMGLVHHYQYSSNSKYSSQLREAENEALRSGGCLWRKEGINYIRDRCFKIKRFHYNAGGNDNFNLNDEYVVFANQCSYSIDMSSWTIQDETSSHLYTFPSFSVDPGGQFTLYTGVGSDRASALYWGRTEGDFAAIWNNGGDTLFLRNKRGDLVLRQSYP